MIETIILIPLADNDGQEFSASHHNTFEEYLVGLFDGLSRLPGTVSGTWVDDGKKYTDDMVSYLVLVKSITEGGKLEQAAKFAKAHYRQEAILVRYLGVAEII